MSSEPLLVTLKDVAQANWRQTEDVDKHDQSTPEAPLQTASPRLRTMEKKWAKISSEFAQDSRVWGASIRDVVNAVSDA